MAISTPFHVRPRTVAAWLVALGVTFLTACKSDEATYRPSATGKPVYKSPSSTPAPTPAPAPQYNPPPTPAYNPPPPPPPTTPTPPPTPGAPASACGKGKCG